MNLDVNKKEILKKLIHIIERKIYIGERLIKEGYEKESLLGVKIGLTSVELTYLFFEIEKEYGIQISQEDINKGGFHTLEGIEKIISDNLNLKTP